MSQGRRGRGVRGGGRMAFAPFSMLVPFVPRGPRVVASLGMSMLARKCLY